MKLRCQNCQNEFDLSSEQERLISKSIKNGQTFLVLECPICSKHLALNPQSIEGNIQENTLKEELIFCPVGKCGGWVSHVKENGSGEDFWGCGECGSIWYEKKNLFIDVEKIISQYPHRKEFYKKTDFGWSSPSIENLPVNYEELILSEEDGMGDSFVRG